MKIQLTRNQLEGLILLLRIYHPYETDSIMLKLLQELMEKLHERLRTRRIKMVTKNKPETNFTLSSLEEKAFYCWYYNMRENIAAEYLSYEVAVADQIFNQIDKEYARRTKP